MLCCGIGAHGQSWMDTLAEENSQLGVGKIPIEPQIARRKKLQRLAAKLCSLCCKLCCKVGMEQAKESKEAVVTFVSCRTPVITMLNEPIGSGYLGR